MHGEALQAAVAWTVVRGPSTPGLRVEPKRRVVRATAGQPTEIELDVTVDGHVATGTTLHLGSPGEYATYEARVRREDGTERTVRGRFQDSPIPLGEIGSGEVQRLTLSRTPNRSHRVYFTASAWNAAAGTAHVDVVVDVDEGRDLGDPLLPPGNDDFAAAGTITGTRGEYGFDLLLASREPGEPGVEKALVLAADSSADARAALRSAAARSVWFTWRAPESGTWYFNVGHRDAPGRRAGGITMSVFQGDDIASLQQVGVNDGGAIAFNAKRNARYRLRVASISSISSIYGGAHDYVLRWQGGDDRPPNDDFANRERVNGAAGRIPGTNQGAGLEPDEFFGDLAATVWYEWTATGDGQWEFHADAMRVRAFVGDSISGLRLVSSHEHGSAVFPASAGQTYRIAVAVPGTETAGGTFELAWRASSRTLAGNDPFSDAARIQGARGSVSGIVLRDATVQDGEPPETGTQTRWWRWRAPGRGPYTWRLNGRNSPLAVLNVFAGDSPTGLRRLAGGREFVIETEPGETYAVAAGKQREASFQDIGNLAFAWGETPVNDVPATAWALQGANGSVSATNAFATTSADEPAVVAGHASLWWRWTAPEAGWYRFRLEKNASLGLYGQPILAVYRMGTGGVPEFIRSTDRSYVLNGELETAVRAGPGASYLVQVASRPRQSPGTVAFDWAPATPPAWLRYLGRVTDGDPVRAGGALALAGARSLVLDDDGNRLFANTERALVVLRRDGRSGSVAPERTIAYRDAAGNDIGWIAHSRLHWDSEQGRLLAFDASNRAAVFRWPDAGAAFAETCRVSDQPRSLSYPERIVSRDGFVYVLRWRDLRVYRIEADCTLDLLQILTGEPLDHAAAERIDGFTETRDGVLGADGTYLYVVAQDSVLRVFERDPDTGALRLASSIRDASTDAEGNLVRFPRSPTSVAVDAAGGFLYLAGSRSPGTALFDLRENPGKPDFVAVVEDFHIRFPILRTHLVWPPSASSCRSPHSPGSMTAAVCRAGAHLVERDTDTGTLRVSDFAGGRVPDRFGHDLPHMGSPLDAVQSRDGRHLYALAAPEGNQSAAILAFSVGTSEAAPPRVAAAGRNTQLDPEGESVQIALAELFESDYPLTFTARSSNPRLVTAEVTGGVLTLRSAGDGEEGAVTVTVTATDADGLSSTLTFEVTVELLPLGLLRGWRRGWLEQEQQRRAGGDDGSGDDS